MFGPLLSTHFCFIASSEVARLRYRGRTVVAGMVSSKKGGGGGLNWRYRENVVGVSL